MSGTYIEKQIAGFETERNQLETWTPEDLAEIIRDVGFSCISCGQCCTTGYNGHVFLLDEDARKVRGSHPESLIPAPGFELIDDRGVFYVSGYALRVREDGSCIFLTDNRCTIYDDRFSICRIYPYMLHREPDRKKNLVFRQISGLNEHGEYHVPISEEESIRLARETISYEKVWLSQMIDFYTAAGQIFEREKMSYVRKEYDRRIQEFKKGAPVTVQVWYLGSFVPTTVRYHEYRGFHWP